jgi:hypothetical protein
MISELPILSRTALCDNPQHTHCLMDLANTYMLFFSSVLPLTYRKTIAIVSLPMINTSAKNLFIITYILISLSVLLVCIVTISSNATSKPRFSFFDKNEIKNQKINLKIKSIQD